MLHCRVICGLVIGLPSSRRGICSGCHYIVLFYLCVELSVAKESSAEATESANKKILDLEAELTLTKAAHEQALRRQTEHASHTQRQLEVLWQAFDKHRCCFACQCNTASVQWSFGRC